jgi:enhancing lycopene biosynthesis protein 2
MSNHLTGLAEQAATALHELARLARPAITPLDISDLRSIAGALAELAAGLPQNLNQLSSYLNDTSASTDPTAGAQDTENARNCLRHAGAAAAHLAAALDATHQTLGGLAETTTIKTGGQFSTGEKGSIFARR